MALAHSRESSGDTRVGRFFRDTYDELRKVVWPTPAELYRYTIVVVVTVVVLSSFIGLVDLAVGEIAKRYVYNGVQH